METFCNVTLAIAGLAGWLGLSILLINFSTCPAFGWFIFVAPIFVVVFVVVSIIAEEMRKDKTFREMGRPYTKATAAASKKSINSVTA